jgi:hypothetical protein
MDYKLVLFRERTDMGKLYVFLPHTGKMLEIKSEHVTELHTILKLMKHSAVPELEELNSKEQQGLLKRSGASEAFCVYRDLKALGVTFNCDKPQKGVLTKYLISRKLACGDGIR